GVPGELYIGGAGVARGYVGRPDLTAEKFIPDPHAGSAGARLYRTGDRVRWLPDGRLEYLGRLDDQVKLRGFRIELGEIEAALAEHPAVAASCAVLREDRPGDRRLAAYVVMAPGAADAVRDLRSSLERKLPPHMVPNFIVPLDALPLTVNGKVDRRALPAPAGLRAGLRAEYEAPESPAEAALASLWRDVLGTERVGAHDDFFELGGHSLLAARLIARIPERLGVTLPLRQIFETPTLRGMAEAVEAVQWAVGAGAAGAGGREEGEI
ncbi:MAG: AMP-binding protein, partial [Gammaproteobacteria bacterium]|nr:AMP-binding protein [Gammaproteobacteria bacterium]